jgi:hypothetical protein
MGKKKGNKKEKQRKRECRQRQYILGFTNEITDGNIPSVPPSMILPVLATRPCLAVRV